MPIQRALSALYGVNLRSGRNTCGCANYAGSALDKNFAAFSYTIYDWLIEPQAMVPAMSRTRPLRHAKPGHIEAVKVRIMADSSGLDCHVGRTEQGTAVRQRSIGAVIGGSLGNIVEWFDWTIYATLAAVFSRQFFPSDDPTVSVLVAFLGFAGGYVMRPVGAILLSPLADRYGRHHLLSLTIILMGLGSLIIGLTPSYASIGILAPIMVIIARLVQGFSAGGEYQAATVYIVENAKPGRITFYSSLNYVSIGFSILLATGVAALITNTIPEPALSTWGWRIPFICASLFSIYGFYVRLKLPSTDSFDKVKSDGKINRQPVRTVLANYPRQCLLMFGIASYTVIYYLWLVYLPTFANLVGGLPLSQGFIGGTISLAVFCVLLPVWGLLADKIGRRTVLIAACLLLGALCVPLYGVLKSGSFALFLMANVAGCALTAMISAVISPLSCELFPADVRTTGVGVPYAFAGAIFGATSPLITTWFIRIGHPDYIAYYVMLFCGLVLAAAVFLPGKVGRRDSLFQG
ncbi:MFS transporter [Methylobacterium terricola]|nr:MFS transporter [Methylobacterium terricola]